MKSDFIAVMLSFFKMGAISFGGGSALIPVIEDEIVEKKKWVDKEQFDFSVIVASISPASLSVALCAVWSHKYSLISSFAYALPGPLIFLILLTGFELIGDMGLAYIGFASVGIIAFIIMILFSFIRKNYLQAVDVGIKYRYLLILTAAFLLTCGNIVRRLFSAVVPNTVFELPNSIFAISMLDLIFMAFFVIFFVGGSVSKIKMGIALTLSAIYAISRGTMSFLDNWSSWITLVMVILAIGSIIYDVISMRKSGQLSQSKKYRQDKKCWRNIAVFLGVSAVFTAIVFIISGETQVFDFALRIMLSSLTSYGGGEVYIGIADAVFVQTGFISAEDFFGRVVGFSSAMPGSVLLATAAGIGFVYGNSIGGIAFAWIFGFLGVILGVAATAFGAIVLYIGFNMFKDSHRLRMITKYMMAIVCGVLISTSLTLINQAASVITREGVSAWISISVVLAIFLVMTLLSKVCKVSNIKLLFIGGLGTLIAMGILF